MAVFDHQFGIVEETTYGTPITVTRFYEIKAGGGFVTEPRAVRSMGLRAGRATMSADMSVRGRPTVAGSFEHDPQTKGFGLLAKMLFGTVSTTGPTSAKYTHTFTVAEPSKFTAQQGTGRPTAATKPFTATGCKITQGTFAGTVGELVSFSFDVDARVGWGSASLTGTTSTTSNVVTMASTAGVVLDMPVTSANTPAGSIVGSVINNTSITVINASTRAAANGTIAGSTTLTFGTALATAAYPASTEPFMCDNISVTVAGATVCAGGFELAVNPNLKTDREKMCNFGLKDEPLRAGLGTYTVKLTGITYDSDTLVDRIVAATAAGAQAQIVITAHGVADPAATLTFTLPACEFTGAFPTMDEGLVEFDLEADVLQPAAGTSPITVAYVSADITP
jgi:hypothetical protein